MKKSFNRKTKNWSGRNENFISLSLWCSKINNLNSIFSAAINCFIIFFLAANWSMSQPFIIAHRGASGNAPENTLVSFRKAMDAGADFLEMDVHLSKDGELVVMHDESVNRTTSGKGKIRNLTLAEIKNLDAGSWFSKNFEGLVVPALDEVFQLANGKIKLLIEIKGTPEKYLDIEKKLVEMIYKYNAKSWCILQSFDIDFLKNVHAIDAGVSLHYLIVGNLIFPSKIPEYIMAVNPNQNFVSKKKVEKLHLQNKKIFVWTVNDEKKMKKLISYGVDGIITNYPEKLKNVIADK